MEQLGEIGQRVQMLLELAHIMVESLGLRVDSLQGKRMKQKFPRRPFRRLKAKG